MAGAMLAAALLAACLPAAASAGTPSAGAASAGVPSASAASPRVGLGKATGFEAAFTTSQPGAASGLSLVVTGEPPAAGTTQAPVVRQVVALPRGTRLDLGALPQCAASDEQLAALGAQAACPATSRVGTGRAEGLLRGAPVVFDLGIYAVRGRLLFAAERDGVGLRQAFAATASGRRLTFVVPTAGGAISPTLFRMHVSAPGSPGWLRTPARCPGSDRWRFTATFTGLTAPEDGTPVGGQQRLRDRQRCD
jgi:hypothetical protein